MSKRKFGEESIDAPLDPLSGATQSEDTSLAGPSDQGDPGGTPQDAAAPASLAGIAAPAASTQDVKDAEAQIGAEPPRAAPKAGEGINALGREVAHPELEAPTPPVEYRVAPSAPGEVEREEIAERPSLEDLKAAATVLVQTVDKTSLGFIVGGIFVTPTPTEVSVQSVADRGQTHLRALATDPRIQVRII